MDDYKLMMAKMHGDELMRKAGEHRRAAEARRVARRRQMESAPTRELVIRPAHRLAMAAARMRPTTTGR